MTAFDTNQVLTLVQEALEKSDLNSAINILQALKPADQADVFGELEHDDKVSLLPNFNPTVSANILENLYNENAAELVTAISNEAAVRIIDQMEPDEAADLLGDINSEQAQWILDKLENPEEVLPLMLHADESAGGLMTSEYLALRMRMTSEEALIAVRKWQPEAETIYYLFVVDGQNVLRGMVSLRQLVVADPKNRLADFMNTDVVSVQVGADQEDCARLMSHYDLLALPVVDAENKLLGVITIDDVIDVMVEEATEDIQRLGGAQPLATPYLRTRVMGVTQTRIGWLLLLFVTESLTGTVLRHFEGELEAIVSLAFFVPLLIGTGGNAGSQTTSTIIRALALGEIDLSDALRSMWHELRVGLLLGIGMAGVAYLRALTWGSGPGLAITVAVAIMTIIVWANALGAFLPIIAAKLKIDPTVVSGPVMSTLVDGTGLFIYFTIAKMVMGI